MGVAGEAGFWEDGLNGWIGVKGGSLGEVGFAEEGTVFHFSLREGQQVVAGTAEGLHRMGLWGLPLATWARLGWAGPLAHGDLFGKPLLAWKENRNQGEFGRFRRTARVICRRIDPDGSMDDPTTCSDSVQAKK